MIANIPLEKIVDNPYQTRDHEDPEHIKNLALSIAQHGMLQTPSGRLVDGIGQAQTDVLRGNTAEQLIDAGWKVQLAFGHSRLAAYKWLLDVQPTSNISGDWSKMPIQVSEFTDEEMFTLAVTENLERRNLTAIEEAKAMAVYRDKFYKNSAEIGELFHLSDSAVRNKIRLLGLPADAQEALQAGQMTEGAARSLLPLYDLPEDLQKQWLDIESRTRWDGKQRSNVVLSALAGEIGSEEVGRRVSNLLESRTKDLSKAWWKYDDVLESNTVRSLKCRDCVLRHDKRCLDENCFQEKQNIFKANYLYLASKVIGIPPLEDDRQNSYEHTDLLDHYYIKTPAMMEKATALIRGGCQNLRVKFDGESEPTQDVTHCIEGYPRAAVVCKNRNGQCRCMTGYEVMQKTAVKGEAAEPVAAEPLSSDQLRQAAADNQRAKHTELENIVKLQELAGKLFARAADSFNERALMYLLLGAGVFTTGPGGKNLSNVIAEKALHFFATNQYYEPSLSIWLANANRVFVDCGLPELKPDDIGSTVEDMLARDNQVAELVEFPEL